ncbi:MAG: hypothetical protein ABI629_00015 [bacterium]
MHARAAMTTSGLAYVACAVLALGFVGCGGSDHNSATASPTPTVAPSTTATALPTPTAAPQKPTFDWGYPRYSEYLDGKHLGTTLYQQDPTCQERLTFYTCDFINAQTPDNDMTNPTMASTAMTGGLDSCTDAIEAVAPSYCVPADVCNPRMQNPAWAPGQASADNLAWQLFIALNWPADAAQPGYPDTAKQLGAKDAAGTAHAETVWLDYPTLADLFGVPSPCEGPTLTMSSKVSANYRSKPHELGSTGGLGDSVEAGGGTLVDQNGNAVFYDIRVNRTEWEFIVNQNDYWMTGASLAGIVPNLVRNYSDPPGRTPGGFPAALVADGPTPGDVGATEIKSAWRQLTAQESAAGTYYTREFNIFDADAPAGQRCTLHRMGLVGLHIIYMPALFGNPEWVWATFEHRLNVPTAGINDGAPQFSFYDANCTPMRTPAECAAYDATKDSPAQFRCCPNLELYPGEVSPASTDLVPNQVTRPTNPTVSTILPTQCTTHYLSAIGIFFGADNVFRNYFLVSTQWPLRGASTNFPFYEPGFEANFPCTMRDSTLETFAVAATAPSLTGCSNNNDVGFCRGCNGDCVATAAEAAVPCPGGEDSPIQYNTADCMGCHGMYAANNSSFIFSHRPCCVRRDGTLPNTCGDILAQPACTVDASCTWDSADPSCASE